ncbi:MAG: hypothetical protein M1832_002674 [Thelocarpon impressellum]|nr:MAG: hypothetical protein M1832_002674 [Thelocarpon impressellum]
MPYTPPSQRSPVASPAPSRSNSYAEGTVSRPPPRADPTRSQSYLSRHRRTPSIGRDVGPPAAPSQAAHGPARASPARLGSPASLHQSLAVLSDASIPAGTIVSPAESSSASDEDRRQWRQPGRGLTNLAELQAAMRSIEQRRESSPGTFQDETKKARAALGITIPQLASASSDQATALQPLTDQARKISHSRSSTDSAIQFASPQTPSPESGSSSDDDDDGPIMRPSMVRKKSGELVKPALRPSSIKRRPTSMPGTPTYGKAVHFDNHLEHVRHFLQVDRPLAVSAGSSPVETFDGDVEFPFAVEESTPPPFRWDIVLPNFPQHTPDRLARPVRVERVVLSPDSRNLIGTAAVANLAFGKLVVVRFTFDYWKTTSEVVAEYDADVRRRHVDDGWDRFNFGIKLADQGNLESKTLFFCVRYNVNGQEFWDNNEAVNFQVDFKKRAAPQTGKPQQPIPRNRSSPALSASRPRSMPISFDDFGDGFDVKYDFSLARQSAGRLVGDASPIRLKSAALPDTPARRKDTAAQAFGNRYDFGASLSAAIQAGGSPGARAGSKATADDARPEPESSVPHAPSVTADRKKQAALVEPLSSPARSRPSSYASEKPPLQSSSYHELLNKYCFFGSAKTSPQASKEGPPAADPMDVTPDKPAEAGRDPGKSPTPVDAAPSDEPKSQPGNGTPRMSRSASPVSVTGSHAGSRMGSPPAYSFQFHHGPGFQFGETHAPTAIHG